MSHTAFSIRLDPRQRDALEQLAAAEGGSVGDVIGRIIDDRVSGAPQENRPNEDAPITLPLLKRYELAMMHDVLAAADRSARDAGRPTEYSEGHHEGAAETLRMGFTGSYGRLFNGIYSATPVNECRLAWDILNMFPAAKASTVIHPSTRERLTYAGLDHNDGRESAIAAYIDFLVRQGRWAALHDDIEVDGGNSHSARLPTYEAMLKVFKPLQQAALREHNRSGELTAEEFILVARAAR